MYDKAAFSATPPDAAAGADGRTDWWPTLRAEAEHVSGSEPQLAPFLGAAILRHPTFEAALANYLAVKLASPAIDAAALAGIASEAVRSDRAIAAAALADLRASKERNPAYRDHLTPFLYFKGFAALQWHRVNHWLWQRGRFELATFLQSRVSEVFSLDIHPAATFGSGIFIDHATGIVVGETARVDDDVSILHGVTLGGTGKETGDRHPKVGRGVLIGACAKILGNITIGECAKIGAGSVVLISVPPHTTAAGVPARIIGPLSDPVPAYSMDQVFADFQI